MKKKVLITGTNGGFDYLSVLTLLKNGYQIVGTMRDC
jgi:NAD(P)-dependent dehydrogenase (short-subunit alcohol dehydrogenase family)